MCGIAGIVLEKPHTICGVGQMLERMAGQLSHRGPDSATTWLDAEAGLGLAFARLSIMDPTPSGMQPMTSDDKRYLLLINGELYNHYEYRRHLAGIRFRGASDSETAVNLIAKFGVEWFLRNADGMYGLAVFDRYRAELTLARDRFGEKPLYYGMTDYGLAFSSELRPLLGLPGVDSRIDDEALCQYMAYRYIPAPFTVYRGVRKLQSASYITVSTSRKMAPHACEQRKFWHPSEMALASPLEGLSDADAQREIERLLLESVGSRLVADVPVGAFLSGGIDSSLVVAMMQEQSPTPVRTFSVGFHGSADNELPAACAIAKHLGTDHTSVTLTAEDARRLVPVMPSVYDEPFADPSQIPTFLVSSIASESVKVVLSGDGGDELFGGYLRYPRFMRRQELASSLPLLIRRGLRMGLSPISELDQRVTSPKLVEWITAGNVESRTRRLTSLFDAGSVAAQYTESTKLEGFGATQWRETPVIPDRATSGEDTLTVSQTIRIADILRYLPEDILTKVDRASMANGLEVRCPMLNADLLRVALRCDDQTLGIRSAAKAPLRTAMLSRVPLELLSGRKVGFGLPLADWLRGPLMDWAADLLSATELKAQSLFDVQRVSVMWKQHRDRKRDWHDHLWAVLMYVEWTRHSGGGQR